MKSWSSLINLHLGEHKDTHQQRTMPGKLGEKEHAEAFPDYVSLNSAIVAWWYPNTCKRWNYIRWKQMPYKQFSDSGNIYLVSHSQYRQVQGGQGLIDSGHSGECHSSISPWWYYIVIKFKRKILRGWKFPIELVFWLEMVGKLLYD